MAKGDHPTVVTVGFRDVPIEFVPLKTREESWGTHVASAAGLEVCLEETLEGLELLQTSIHEITHAIVHTYIPAGTTRNLPPGTPIEECYVDAFATGLVQVLRDNPTYLDYINRAIKESL